jgi:outer membrane protein assembly factor BamB
MKKHLALLGLTALALAAACSKEKNVEPPAELVDFKASLAIDRVWSVSTGGGDEHMRYALAPVVEGDVVYLAGDDGDVLAVDSKTGRRIWKVDVDLPLSAGPGAGEGLVLVGSPNGDLVALDAANGKERWRTTLGGEILARPAAGDAMVVVHTVDGTVHGLKAADGTQVWTYEQPVPRLSLRGTAPPVVAGDSAVCAFDNGKVASLGLADGDLLWSATVATPHGRTELERLVDIDSAVAVDGDDIFVVGYQGRAAMLASNSGQIWWARDTSSYRGLALDDSSLYVSTAEGAVLSLSQRDGTEQWRQNGLRLRGLTAPAVDGTAIVVGDFEGYLHWLDRDSGEMAARASAGGDRITNAPVSANGMVFVQSDGGTVYAFRSRPRR